MADKVLQDDFQDDFQDDVQDDFQDDFQDGGDFLTKPRRRGLKPQPIRKRRGGFVRKMLIMVVLGVGAGFGAYIYTEGDRVETTRLPAMIGKMENPFKVKPASPGGMEVRHRDRSIFDRLLSGRNSKKPEEQARLSRPPEEPRLTERAARSRPDEDGVGIPLSRGNSTTEPNPGDVASVAPEAPPGSPGDVASVAPEAPPVSTSDIRSTDLAGEYRVQLASLRSDGAVKRAWVRIQRDFPDLLGELALSVERQDLGADRGIFYRLQAGPLESMAAANELCGALKTRKRDCIVVKP